MTEIDKAMQKKIWDDPKRIKVAEVVFQLKGKKDTTTATFKDTTIEDIEKGLNELRAMLR